MSSSYVLQALSINRSLSKAKSAAEKGHIKSRELINSVIESVQGAGGRIDYAEVRQGTLFSFLYLF